MKPSEKIIKVALNVPVNDLFDYVAENEAIQIGQYVKVPFGKRNLIGVVYGFSNSSKIEKNKLKKIIHVDQEILFDKNLLKLLSFVSDYYQFPIGQTIMSVVPARIKQDKSHINRVERLIEPTKILTQVSIEDLPGRQIRLRKLAQILLKGPIRQTALAKLMTNALPLIKTLEVAGLCSTKEWQLEQEVFKKDLPPQLTSEQKILLRKF